MFLQGWQFIDNFKGFDTDLHDALEQIQNVAGITQKVSEGVLHG